MAAVEATLLGMPAGTRGFRLKVKPELVVLVVLGAAELAVEAPGAAPGALRLKPNVPAPGAAAVVAGAERERPVAAEVEGAAAAMEEKSVGSVGPTVVAAVTVVVGTAIGCVAPAVVAASVAAVKGKLESAVD